MKECPRIGEIMIKGTGIDITEIERIKNNLNSQSFLYKIYSNRELEYLESRKFNPQTAAGMFAAKEAVAKCLGTGFSNFGPCHIEILKDEMGKPTVNLTGNALKKALELNITIIHISISHTKDYAVAQCVAE
jgi:phosphopantetheine--protein transferase-like protein